MSIKYYAKGNNYDVSEKYEVATSTKDGLMAKTDKVNLDFSYEELKELEEFLESV